MDAARSRSASLDVLLDVVDEDTQIGGGILAGALAYRLFLFILPLALLLIAVLGLVADAFNSSPRTVGNDTGLLSLVTNDVASAAEGRSSVWIALSALVFLGYATRVLYRSICIVHALAWHHSAAPAKSESRSLKLFALGVAVQITLTAAVSTIDPDGVIATVIVTVGLALAIGAVWLGIAEVLPHAKARWHELIPGAVLYGIGIVVIHAFDVYLLAFVHRSRANAYGTLGAAAAVLLSLFFIGRLIVGATVLNATLYRRRHGTPAPPALDVTYD